MTVSAFLKPCDSPGNAMYACLMPWAARSAAIASDCEGGTIGSSRPWSSRIGQVEPGDVADRGALGVEGV